MYGWTEPGSEAGPVRPVDPVRVVVVPVLALLFAAGGGVFAVGFGVGGFTCGGGVCGWFWCLSLSICFCRLLAASLSWQAMLAMVLFGSCPFAQCVAASAGPAPPSRNAKAPTETAEVTPSRRNRRWSGILLLMPTCPDVFFDTMSNASGDQKSRTGHVLIICAGGISPYVVVSPRAVARPGASAAPVP